MKKLVKSCVSLLLVACMLLGVVPATMLTAHAAEENDTIVYASLGDSMTNGYCLYGYDGESGVVNYAVDTYANKFAATLAGYTGSIADDQVIFTGTKGTVDHRPLALSGMRAEDFQWALELDYENSDLMNQLYAGGFRTGSWDANKWYKTWGFTSGDRRTWADFCDYEFRYADAAAKILQIYNTGDNGDYFTSSYADATAIANAKAGLSADTYFPENKSQADSIGGAKYLQISTEYYQKSIADADVISLAVGNTNFGTHMLSEIMDVVMSNDLSFSSTYPVSKAWELAAMDPLAESKATAMLESSAYQQIIAKCTSLAADDARKTEIKNIVDYCMISYITGYIGMLNAILELNPDAHIIQIALMNAYEEKNGEVLADTLGELVEIIYTPVNAFLKALPADLMASKSAAEQAEYADAKFYFADAGHVSCMVDVYGDDFYTGTTKYPGLLNGYTFNEDNTVKAQTTSSNGLTPNRNSIVRDRFVEEIVGGDQLFANIDKATKYQTSYHNPDITPAEIKDYQLTFDSQGNVTGGVVAYAMMTAAQKAAFAAANSDLAQEYAYYLAFEDALIRSGPENITLASLANLGQVGDAFATEAGAIKTAAYLNGAAYYEDVYAALAKIVETNLENTLKEYKDNPNFAIEGITINFDVDLTVTAEEIGTLIKAGSNETERMAAATAIANNAITDVYKATVLLNGINGINKVFGTIISTLEETNDTYGTDDLNPKVYQMSALHYYNYLNGTNLSELNDEAKTKLLIFWAEDSVTEYTDVKGKTHTYPKLAEYLDACQINNANEKPLLAGKGILSTAKENEEAAQGLAMLTKFGLQLKSDEALQEGMNEFEKLVYARQTIAESISGNTSLSADNVGLLGTLLALPQTMSDILFNNSILQGALTMNARVLLGTGAGGHPSTAGHESLYQAIRSAFPTTCAFGHDYGQPSWNWADDYKSATATFTCSADKTHVQTITVDSTSEIVDETCENDGKVTYTATVEFNGKTYSDKKETILDKTGHAYGEPAWTWAEDYQSATATFTCTNDETHVESVKADSKAETVDETCETDGKVTYTATVEFDGKTYSDEEVKVLDKTGHKYGEPEWTWAEDYKTATATFTCENDATHTKTLEAAATSVTKEATCETDGKVTYTAEVELEGKPYTDSKEVAIPAAHKLGDPVTADGVTKKVCSACGYTESKITTDGGDVEIEVPAMEDGLTLVVDHIGETTDERYILVQETFEEYAAENKKDVTVLKTFDITLKNAQGVHEQPDGTIKVKLPIGSDKEGNYKVYYVDDEGNIQDMNAVRQGSHMVFETTHFSLYVLVEVSDHVHNLKLKEAVAATCTAEGSKAYYTCSGCDLWFEDAEGKTEIKDKTSVVTAALGHTWVDATCTAPKTCSVCETTDGEALGHTWVDATCTTPKTCSVCEATDGEALGHTWVDATCTTPKTCSVCEATDGTEKGHDWDEGVVTTEPTEDKNGVRTYTCQICEETKTETIAALGHTHSYTTVVTAPTCTEKGYTTYTCACGDTYVANQVAASGHTIVKGSCSVCGVEDPAEADMFKLYGANMLLGNNLAMNFYIELDDLAFGEDYYAVITKEYADGRDDLVVTVDAEDWEEAYGMYRITLDQIAAKEMADDIIVVIYNDEDEQVSKTWVDSVRDYTLRVLAAEEAKEAPDEELLALYVEMLNYGAAAQEHFDYNETDLANADLTAAQKAYGLASVGMEDFSVKGTGYVGTSLTLESNILMNFYFNNIPADHEDMYAIATFTDHYGKAQQIKIEGKDFAKHNSSTYKISVAGLVIADCKELVTIKVYDAKGAVVASAVDSIESYTARMDGDDALYVAIMKFANAAYDSFH